jgi:transposase
VVYGNQRQIRGARGQSLMRHRGELIERSLAHTLETGGMRRTHLRGHENIAKRMLIHIAGFNLGLLMRKRFRSWQTQVSPGPSGRPLGCHPRAT